MLHLRYPNAADEKAARALHDALIREDFEFILAEGSWAEVLSTVEEEACGTNLPPGQVRADYLLADVNGTVVGRSSIRYALTPELRTFVGHVGYGVGPEFRHRGYATEILRQSLGRLRLAGVDTALVMCDNTNIASARTIERCGGALESVVPQSDRLIRRYAIPTAEAI